MESIQVWRPDTCECSLHEAVDDITNVSRFVTEAEARLIHESRFLARPTTTLNPALRPQPPAGLCPFHSTLGNTLAHFNAVLGENRRKNQALPIAQSVRPAITDAMFTWEFTSTLLPDQGRQLRVSFPGSGITSQQRSQVQSTLDLQYGPNAIVVV